ncbi:hypothetical protein LCGC14_1192940 [marine sediment metagenome]|uniref:Uncharacterized protein n=1 Tax=marine sediment metagenome TaxID=412755 RepID=A0A0F9LNK2_9ZZZZ
MYSFGLNFRYVFGSDGMRRDFHRWIVQDRNTGRTIFAYHHQNDCTAKYEAEIACKRFNGISVVEVNPQRKANPGYGYWYQEFHPPINQLPQLPKE